MTMKASNGAWQVNPYLRGSWTGRDAGVSAMGDGNRLDDREAEAGTPATSRLVAPAEALESPLSNRLVEACAFVADREPHACARALSLELDSPSPVGDGVLDEVRQRLLQPQAISLENEIWIRHHRQRAIGGSHSRVEATCHRPKECVGVQRSQTSEQGPRPRIARLREGHPRAARADPPPRCPTRSPRAAPSRPRRSEARPRARSCEEPAGCEVHGWHRRRTVARAHSPSRAGRARVPPPSSRRGSPRGVRPGHRLTSRSARFRTDSSRSSSVAPATASLSIVDAHREDPDPPVDALDGLEVGRARALDDGPVARYLLGRELDLTVRSDDLGKAVLGIEFLLQSGRTQVAAGDVRDSDLEIVVHTLVELIAGLDEDERAECGEHDRHRGRERERDLEADRQATHLCRRPRGGGSPNLEPSRSRRRRTACRPLPAGSARRSRRRWIGSHTRSPTRAPGARSGSSPGPGSA